MSDFEDTGKRRLEHEVTMTAGELVAKLSELPPDTPVYTEGCDCIGNAADVRLDESLGGALITRSE